MKFLMPKQPSFFQLLRDQAACLEEIAKLFEDFAHNFNDFPTYAKKAAEIESRADDKAHEMVNRINKTFITPLDREDLYTVTSEIDDIVDLLEDVIHNIEIYGVKEKKDFVDRFAQIIPKSAGNLKELVGELEKLKYTKIFNELVIKIHDLEDQGDMIFQDGIGRLFKEEKDPVEIIKWKEILEDLEQIMDKLQDTSNTLEGIIVKSQ